MSGSIQRVSPYSEKIRLTAVLIVYILISSIWGIAYRYELTPDTIVFIRLATDIAQGHFGQSVTSAWPPFITWLTAPLLLAGLDGLTVFRIMLVFSGLMLVLSTWLLTFRFDLDGKARLIAIATSGFLIAQWTVLKPGPNLLFTAFIILYLYIVTDPEILLSKKKAFACGIVAGFAYLTKHYAFPFFIVHFPLLLMSRGFAGLEKKVLSKKVLVSLLCGIAGLVIISSPWIAAVSAKYGKFTISSAGRIAHSIVGPNDTDRRPPPFYGGLHKPRYGNSLHIYEDPSGLDYKTWSPLESKEYFVYQIGLTGGNIIQIYNLFVRQSQFFTFPLMAGIIVLIPIAVLVTPPRRRKKYLYWWVVVTFCVYSSGLILTYVRSPKYFYPLMLVVVLASFHCIEELRTALERAVENPTGHRSRRLFHPYLIVLLILAFTLKPASHFFRSAVTIMSVSQVNAYSDIAEQIKSADFQGPYAIIRSSQKPYTDLYIAYYLGKQFLGRPLSADTEGISGELEAAGARSLLVFDNPELAEQLIRDKRYVLTDTIKLKKDERYWNEPNVKNDNITAWDSMVNIFSLRPGVQ